MGTDRCFFTCTSEPLLLILGTPITHVTGNLKLSHRSLIICLSFLHYSFFSVCFLLNNVYFCVIKLASLSFSAVSNLPLQLSSIVFISHMVIFTSRHSILVFCMSSMALTIISSLQSVPSISECMK